jgi:hypothetical protein
VHIPSSFYGLYRNVKPRCRRIVTKLARGEALNDVIGADDTIDTATQPGMLVLEGLSPLLGGQPHFHCYLLHFQIKEAQFEGRLNADMVEEIFNASLQTEWGVLGLIAYQSTMWFAPPEKWRSTRYQPMLKACLQFWDTFEREGERYSGGSNSSKNLWNLPNTIRYILANMGVSKAVLKAPLPATGLAGVVALALSGDDQSH